MIELLFWWREYEHPPSGSTLRLSRRAGDLRNDEQIGRWAASVMRSAWDTRDARQYLRCRGPEARRRFVRAYLQ